MLSSFWYPLLYHLSLSNLFLINLFLSSSFSLSVSAPLPIINPTNNLEIHKSFENSRLDSWQQQPFKWQEEVEDQMFGYHLQDLSCSQLWFVMRWNWSKKLQWYSFNTLLPSLSSKVSTAMRKVMQTFRSSSNGPTIFVSHPQPGKANG